MFEAGKIQKYRRYFAYLIAASIPLVTFWLLVYFGFAPETATIYAFLTTIISLFLSNLVSVNALTRVKEDAKFLAMTFDSRGSLILYNAVVNQNKPIIKIENSDKEFFYSRNIIHRLVFAINPPKAKVNEQENGNLQITIPKEDVYNSYFLFEGVQTILYNRNIDNIITKDYLRQREEGMFLENQLNITNMALDKLVALTESYTQTFIQKFFNKQTTQNIFLIIIIILIVIIGLFIVKPAIEPALSSAGNIIQPIQNAVPVQPLPQ